MSGPSDARRFWDARARENSYFFVDNRLDYRSPDVERFWSQGEADLDRLLASAGVEIEAGDRLLDIGCGLGRLTRPIARRGESVVGLDVSTEMLDQARALNRHLGNVEWILGNGQDLAGVAGDSVDACVSHVVFQHIPDPRVTYGYVREIARVLRPGGWGVFQVSNDPRIHRTRGSGPAQVFRTLVRRAPRGVRHAAWVGSAVDLGELRAVAHGSGLTVERIEGEGTQFCIVLVRRTG